MFYGHLPKYSSFLLLIGLFFHQIGYSGSVTTIKILGVSDFHGQINEGRYMEGRAVGSAPFLASYLRQAQHGLENNTLIAFTGDQFGASPAISSLLHDEPTILFLNQFTNESCHYLLTKSSCNVVATLGNHEFDHGITNLFELVHGANKAPSSNWIDLIVYPGAHFPYISANTVDKMTGQPLFPTNVLVTIAGVRIGVIGAITKDAANMILPENIVNISFEDEIASINQQIPELKAQGAEIIILLIHEGGYQKLYDGNTQENTQPTGRILSIINQLDDNIDVVLAGHTHQFMNAFVENQHGKQILLAQAGSNSNAFSDVTIQFDKLTQHTVNKTARIVVAYADDKVAIKPDEQAQKLVQCAYNATKPFLDKPITVSNNRITREITPAGESALGDLITEAIRYESNTDIAFYNLYGLRNDFPQGRITWGDIYSVLPFGNNIVTMTLTGQEIIELLGQQWSTSKGPNLQIAGMEYSYNTNYQITSISINGQPIQLNYRYKIATTNFLASGVSGFTLFLKGKDISVERVDLDMVTNYLTHLPQPISMYVDGRIKLQ